MADSMIEMLTSELVQSGALSQMMGKAGAPSESGSLARQLGVDESTVSSGVAAALPMLITALARNASAGTGAQDLSGALTRDHDGSVLDNLTSYVSRGGDVDDGNAILGHVLGGQREVVVQGLSKSAGVDPSLLHQLLPMLAPVVLGYLGRQQRQQQYSPDDLSSYLQREQQQMVQKAPQEANLGGLASLLDMDKDGDITDDAARLGAGLLQSFLKGRK